MTASPARAARPHQSTPTRAAIYVRQSLDATGDGLAVARQDKVCRELAKSRGWSVVAVYRDNSVSATRGKDRPGFGSMLTAARGGEFDVIVAYHLDRLTRTLRDFLPLQALADEHGVKVCTVSGDLDMTTDAGEMVAGILTLVASGEVKRKGARQKLAAAQRAEAGLPSQGGPRPFGYEPDRVTVRESEAVHIRTAFDSLLAGASASSIARDLNAAGFVTAKGGKPFRHPAVRQMLTNPRYAGLRAHRGEIVGAAVWPALVAEDAWHAAQAILTDPARRTNHGTGERRNLLTGLALCGVCSDGTTLLVSYAGGRRTYRCKRSKHLSRAADVLDEFVVKHVLERLSRPDATDLLVDEDRPDVPALRRQAQTLRKRLDSLALAHVRGEVTDRQLRVGTAEGTRLLAELDDTMARTDRAPILAELVHGDADALWSSLSLARRQAVIGSLMTVTVNKGRPGGNSRMPRRPLDSSTVRVDWLTT